MKSLAEKSYITLTANLNQMVQLSVLFQTIRSQDLNLTINCLNT